MTMKGNQLRRGTIVTELLLLVTVTGLATGICAWKQGERLRVSREQSAKAQIAEFCRALWLYYCDVGTFPHDTRGLIGLVQDSGTIGWRGPYLAARQLPRDPWGREYRYLRIGPFDRRYEIVSAGPDRQFGSEDDIGITFRAPEETRPPIETFLTDRFQHSPVCI